MTQGAVRRRGRRKASCDVVVGDLEYRALDAGGYAARRARFRLAFASFSSTADTMNSMSDVSLVTQCSFSRRCSSLGIRVASWTQMSSSTFDIRTSCEAW